MENLNEIVNFVVGMLAGILKIKSLFISKRSLGKESGERSQIQSNDRLKAEKVLVKDAVIINIVTVNNFNGNSTKKNYTQSNQVELYQDEAREQQD